jgi:RNA polymerase sigma-70 factor (ECF subfamily)
MIARTDDVLMSRVCGGDRAAFAELFVRYRESIWRFFRRRTSDPAQAEELAQDTFAAVLAGAARFEARGSFRSYLFGIAFNILMDARRRQRPAAPLEDSIAAPPRDPATGLWVRQALERLEPEEREILMLREYEQLSYDEIAQTLALPLNTVRSRLFRARAAMREVLAGDGPSQEIAHAGQ